MQTGGRSVARILDYALQFGGHLVSVSEGATLLAGESKILINASVLCCSLRFTNAQQQLVARRGYQIPI
jgi:hypothetical protein